MKKGVFIKSRDPELSRIAAVAGLDFLILDREHGILSLSDIRAFNFGAGTELKTFVRLKNIMVDIDFAVRPERYSGVIREDDAHGSVCSGDEFIAHSDPDTVLRDDLPAVPDTRHPLASGDYGALYRVAQRLQQDCIAVYDETLQRGQLVGPRASAWGTFNPSFFLNLDGTRLQ